MPFSEERPNLLRGVINNPQDVVTLAKYHMKIHDKLPSISEGTENAIQAAVIELLEKKLGRMASLIRSYLCCPTCRRNTPGKITNVRTKTSTECPQCHGQPYPLEFTFLMKEMGFM